MRAILRGIRNTLKVHKAMQSDIEKNRRAVMAMAISVSGVNVTSKEKSEKLSATGITKLDGGTLKLNFEDGNFKKRSTLASIPARSYPDIQSLNQ